MLQKAFQTNVTFSVIFRNIREECNLFKVVNFPMVMKEIDLGLKTK